MPKKAHVVLAKGMVERLVREATATRDIADAGCPGLTLRLHPTGSVWTTRMRVDGRQVRILIGPVDAWPLPQARQICSDIRGHVLTGHGVPDPAWIELKRQAFAHQKRRPGKDGEDGPVVPEFMPKRVAPTTWTYAQACDAWVAWLRSEAAAGSIRPHTVENYRRLVRCPALRTLDARHVARIEAPDVAAVVSELVQAGKRSQARDIVRVGKRLWKWLAAPGQVRASGVTPKVMADLEAPKLGNVKARQYFPKVPEIALALRYGQHGVLADSLGMAIQLLCWTAQRRLTIVRALIDEFIPWPERPGWGIWNAGHRKMNGVGPHAIPLPPSVWWRVKNYVRYTTDHAEGRGRERSEWMFPQKRARRVGMPDDGHMSADALSHGFTALPGVDASPHDVRRAFATVLQGEAGIPSAAVGMILDHAESDLLHVTDGKVTRRYTGEEMLDLKAPAIEAWAGILVAAARDVELPDGIEIKRRIVEANLARKGVKDHRAEKERLRALSAAQYAEGRTHRQRRKAGAT